MSDVSTASPTAERPSLVERMAGNADGILEKIAAEYGVSTLDAVKALPEQFRTIVPGAAFEKILAALVAWGPVVFIVHTPDIVLECEGPIPPGTYGRGYFNLHGDSPIGGHIRAENCETIVFVARPFMGRESLSLQFFNGAGEAMFKVFVRRDDKRDLIAEQVALYNDLRKSYKNGSA
ncbi:heme utilization cystosolic carrier protein HutX [Hyphomicrobium methylovorum]|uniref:heme utilization cystosolic carrier protein HutX n=1 Tax=Hyphomicrobium methylovorum TaxID=84 RepID=UPI0015E71F1C|nr:heme utilization cystosolic carrier protein HutX [Hyphomicrobium methylovorum]MBA2126046.1 heme utilization cystosolic carrier protein HutX [Hyphomicrobium methylovorum]